MSETEHEPVIIGCGLTGMVISDQLTRADISHVLIGDPPGDQPRLGESLDPAGTIQLLNSYPEFDEFYHKKRGITVFSGECVTTCDFSQTAARSLGLRMMGFQSPPEFIDIDRVGFDQALYQKVVASEYCTRLDSLVDTVEYDEETDTVEELHLQGWDTLRPSYVFDCTNFVRLLGRALEIPVDRLSEPQRVVFTDYHAAAEPDGGVRQIGGQLKHADHLVRLYAETDGIDGLAWAIPIDSYVSVGISMPNDQDDLGTDEVLRLVEDAYRRRGMDLLDSFDEHAEVTDIPRQQYFIHERAYGQNWLLAGPSYGHFWFPSASGVSTSLLAASLAPGLLEYPEKLGHRYQEYVDGLRESHDIFDRLITRDRDEISRELVETEIDRIIAENVKRVGRLSTIQHGPLTSGTARLFMTVADRDGVIQGDCEVYTADLARQAWTVFDNE